MQSHTKIYNSCHYLSQSSDKMEFLLKHKNCLKYWNTQKTNPDFLLSGIYFTSEKYNKICTKVEADTSKLLFHM